MFPETRNPAGETDRHGDGSPPGAGGPSRLLPPSRRRGSVRARVLAGLGLALGLLLFAQFRAGDDGPRSARPPNSGPTVPHLGDTTPEPPPRTPPTHAWTAAPAPIPPSAPAPTTPGEPVTVAGLDTGARAGTGATPGESRDASARLVAPPLVSETPASGPRAALEGVPVAQPTLVAPPPPPIAFPTDLPTPPAGPVHTDGRPPAVPAPWEHPDGPGSPTHRRAPREWSWFGGQASMEWTATGAGATPLGPGHLFLGMATTRRLAFRFASWGPVFTTARGGGGSAAAWATVNRRIRSGRTP